MRGFNDYYQQNIRRKLADLEASRSAAIQRRNKRLLVGVPIMLVLSVLAVANIEEDTILQDVVGMILFLGWLATFGYAIGDSRKIKGMAKGVMIESLSAFFQLTYGTRTPSIEMRLFRETGLVPEYDGWVAKEAFSGDRDGVHMVMAEVRLYDHSRKGGRRRRVTKFQGAVLQFGQPKQFLGQTVALARRGLATNIVDQIIRGKPRIRLENQEFEALFDVFADDEVEARYLLTPLFMERMVGLAELVGKGSDLRFAFADNQLLVAVSGWDLFEAAALSHAVSDPVQVQTFINEVGLILDVAETLKLTQKTRI
ncbi:MAG: DUF3137 domain-containing protein [Rhodospirillaceae bacterium]|nr:DUF3137 domain-containing protein [Rhodospirillaceae bacterium]